MTVIDRRGPDGGYWTVEVRRHPKLVTVTGDSYRVRPLVDTKGIWDALWQDTRAKSAKGEVVKAFYGTPSVTPYFYVPKRFEAQILETIKALPFKWETGH